MSLVYKCKFVFHIRIFLLWMFVFSCFYGNCVFTANLPEIKDFNVEGLEISFRTSMSFVCSFALL